VTIGVVVAVLLANSACTTHRDRAPQVSPGESVSSTPSREERWAKDIEYLIDRMQTIHPDLYHGVTRSQLNRAADSLVARLPHLDDDQVLVGLMQLVALISSHGRDGHMGVWPPDNTAIVHRYPILLWEFSDGLYVTAARSPNQDLVGWRVRAVEGIAIDDVLGRLDPVVPRDNDSNLRAARLVFLTSAEVLVGLGIARDAAHIGLDVDRPDGQTRTATLDAIDGSAFQDWVGAWELALPERGDMLLLRDTQDVFWIDYLARNRALYVQYNHIEPDSSDLVEALRAAERAHPVDRVILDLRNNGGGEAEGYSDILDLLSKPTFDRPRRLYVLIGRLTFSAAASFVAELEQKTDHVVFEGEPTGGAPNFWADVVTVTLPNSRLKALVSDAYEGFGRPGDPRLAIDPDVSVPFASADYFSGEDPVLDAALAA
jgi:hypothetical protein